MIPDDEDPVEMPIDGVLDLHAFRPRDVPDLVADYLDACRARGITQVRIVHGKGTGTLQRTVHALLSRRGDVLHHALAPGERGGWGATLVTLRPAVRIITPAQWTAQPWRNGGGITHEIAREGPADAFSWRVSVADVTRPGAFSVFPGVDRLIALVEGDGFELSGDVRATMRRPGDWFAFPGDVRVDCALLGGPVRDLNVMVDRSRWRVEPAAGPHVVADGLLLAFAPGDADIDGIRVARHHLVIAERDLHIAGPLLVARLRPI